MNTTRTRARNLFPTPLPKYTALVSPFDLFERRSEFSAPAPGVPGEPRSHFNLSGTEDNRSK
eukprot:1292271-Pyramimonas_sp.AAC.1